MSRKARVVLITACLILATAGAGVLMAVTVDSPFDVPGTVPSASPIKGTLHSVTDEDRVYRLRLSAGQWFYAGMSGAKGTDFDLHLFGPQTSSVATTQPALKSSEVSGSSAERILYQVPQTGDYYLNVWAYSGAGTYTVDYGTPSHQPSTTLAAPATIAWGGTASISGTMAVAGNGVAAKRVELRRRLHGQTAFTTIATAVTSSTGGYRFSIKPTARAGYSAVFAGDTTHLPASSTVATVSPSPYLSRPSSPTSVRKGMSFTSVGWLRPQYPNASRTVRIWCYRMDSKGEWVFSHRVLSTNTSRYSYSRYAAPVRLPSAGKWKLVAAIPQTNAHSSKISQPTLLTVRP